MISSPVLTVPALAQAPEAMLARVYVFANGIKDGGPLKFQRPDLLRLAGIKLAEGAGVPSGEGMAW